MNNTTTRFFFGLLSMIVLLLMIVTNTFILKLVWVFFFALIQIIVLFELFSNERWGSGSMYHFLVTIFSFVYMLIYLLFINTNKFELFGVGLIVAVFVGALITPQQREKKHTPQSKPAHTGFEDVEVVDIEPPRVEEIRAPVRPEENVFEKLEQSKAEREKIAEAIAKQAKELEKASKELEKTTRKMTSRKPAKKKVTKKKAVKKKATKKKTVKKKTTKKKAAKKKTTKKKASKKRK